jgi:alanine-synthesizing transaminase
MFASRTNWYLTPNRLSKLLAERRRQGIPLLDLTESNPTRCGFTFNPQEILGALANPRALTYEPDPRGLLPARQAVAHYYLERGIIVDPEQIFLTTSTSEAYSYLFRLLTNPQDNVLVPQPSYPLFDFLGSLNDVEIHSYPLDYHDAWQVGLHELEAKVNPRTRAILVVHPNNPTGSFILKSELESLVRFSRANDLALIADEVFSDYAFGPDEQRVVSHAGISGGLTFTLSGLSKISALPQMKLAWIVVNGPANDLREAMARLEIIADTYLSVNAPLAHALPKLLESRKALQPQVLERVKSNLHWLDEQITADALVRRLQVEGGWYAILRLPSTRTDEEWAIAFLREDGVIVHPGHFYDFQSDGYLVISLLPEPEVFRQGIRKILARASRSE